jgi:Protein of unknown function (DUF1353)
VIVMAQAYFEGEVRTEWLVETATDDDGADRRMQLLEDFAFTDSAGTRWLAPLGHIVDGASIPRLLWSVAGSPYTGAYRRASVLHDVACDERTVPSKLVHKMFYDAMICDGVDRAQALEFYTAVRLFGPSWDDPAPMLARGRKRAKPRLKAKRKPSFAQVEKALDAALGE